MKTFEKVFPGQVVSEDGIAHCHPDCERYVEDGPRKRCRFPSGVEKVTNFGAPCWVWAEWAGSKPTPDEPQDRSMDELHLARHASCHAGGAHKFVEARHVRYTDADGHEHHLFCEKCGRWA